MKIFFGNRALISAALVLVCATTLLSCKTTSSQLRSGHYLEFDKQKIFAELHRSSFRVCLNIDDDWDYPQNLVQKWIRESLGLYLSHFKTLNTDTTEKVQFVCNSKRPSPIWIRFVEEDCRSVHRTSDHGTDIFICRGSGESLASRSTKPSKNVLKPNTDIGIKNTLKHELGHAFGLADLYVEGHGHNQLDQANDSVMAATSSLANYNYFTLNDRVGLSVVHSFYHRPKLKRSLFDLGIAGMMSFLNISPDVNSIRCLSPQIRELYFAFTAIQWTSSSMGSALKRKLESNDISFNISDYGALKPRTFQGATIELKLLTPGSSLPLKYGSLSWDVGQKGFFSERWTHSSFESPTLDQVCYVSSAQEIYLKLVKILSKGDDVAYEDGQSSLNSAKSFFDDVKKYSDEPLEKELAFMTGYVDQQKTRFRDVCSSLPYAYFRRPYNETFLRSQMTQYYPTRHSICSPFNAIFYPYMSRYDGLATTAPGLHSSFRPITSSYFSRYPEKLNFLGKKPLSLYNLTTQVNEPVQVKTGRFGDFLTLNIDNKENFICDEPTTYNLGNIARFSCMNLNGSGTQLEMDVMTNGENNACASIVIDPRQNRNNPDNNCKPYNTNIDKEI